ncbi:hypothetical protein HQ544_02460 [Candidatus Falkowbacteria bacterium]|nr:hypothetical protein [Candidatus Falkowbacteria bacterium]
MKKRDEWWGRQNIASNYELVAALAGEEGVRYVLQFDLMYPGVISENPPFGLQDRIALDWARIPRVASAIRSLVLTRKTLADEFWTVTSRWEVRHPEAA